MVSNGNSQSKTDFIPKRDFIGRKFVETDERNRFFWSKSTFSRTRKNGCFLSGGDETDFAVSFDGSFSRGFEGTEFIVSLP